MDPPLISEASFASANPSLAEIWPFNGGSIEESTVTEQTGSGGRKRRTVAMEDQSSKIFSANAINSDDELNGPVGKQLKLLGCENEKFGTEASSAGGLKPSEKIDQTDEPPKDYIHVRARRGQATDSHSLAERARREKISERMKSLQDLVPGCNKVIGKALVLDEIINYIQSLQRQVEFLSMKLEAVNSGINPAVNGFPPKDPEPPTFDATGMMFGSQETGREYTPVMDTEWLHMHLGGGGNFGRTA